MYKIIGADGKEYGPIEITRLRQWVADGRINPRTKVKEEGAAEWTAHLRGGGAPERRGSAEQIPQRKDHVGAFLTGNARQDCLFPPDAAARGE